MRLSLAARDSTATLTICRFYILAAIASDARQLVEELCPLGRVIQLAKSLVGLFGPPNHIVPLGDGENLHSIALSSSLLLFHVNMR